MNGTGPLALIAGILLLGFGLIYPMASLLQLSRQLNKGPLQRNRIVITLVLNAVLPLTSILAGFWLLSPRVQESLVFAGALGASALLLVITLVARWRIKRSQQ